MVLPGLILRLSFRLTLSKHQPARFAQIRAAVVLLVFAEATSPKSLIFHVEVSRWNFGEAQAAIGSAVPGDDGGGFHDRQGGGPVGPDLPECDPEGTIDRDHFRAPATPNCDGELLSEGEVL